MTPKDLSPDSRGVGDLDDPGWRRLRQSLEAGTAPENRDLTRLYEHLNDAWFAGALPPCRFEWSRRLTRSAALIDVRSRLIRFSLPLLARRVAPRAEDSRPWAGAFDVCGVRCECAARVLREVLLHEMIHLHLFEKGRSHGHTREFREMARALGHSSIRHRLPGVGRARWIARCPVCGGIHERARRPKRSLACGACCRVHSGAKFDARFVLRFRSRESAVDKIVTPQ